jgi:hypothetical protein
MTKRIISADQLSEAKGLFDTAAARFGVDTEIYEDDRVPRPTLRNLIDSAARQGVVLPTTKEGSVVLEPTHAPITASHPGLRGIAHYRAGETMHTAPAIVLRGGKQVAVLLSDANPRENNALKQSLLENLYTTQHPDITAHGSANRVVPAVGGHALVAASFVGNPAAAHEQVHNFDHGNFGANFDMAGNRDIFFGTARHDVLRVRSAVLGLGQVILEVARAYQLDENDTLLGGGMSTGQLNIALTVAATLSSPEKQGAFNPAAAMEAMTK